MFAGHPPATLELVPLTPLRMCMPTHVVLSACHDGLWLQPLPPSSSACLQADDVREAVRRLRDLERAPHGAPTPPDPIVTLQRLERLEEVGVDGVVGMLVRVTSKAALALTARL